MKVLRLLGLVSSSLLVLSCGGGGGGSVPATPPTLYAGLTTPAVVTSTNTMDFVDMMFGASLEPPDISGGIPAASLQTTADKALSESLASVAGTLSRIPVSGTFEGSVSGTVTFSGNIETDGTGAVTFVCTSYSDGDGVTLDGKFVLKILAVDEFNLEITHAVIEFWSLRSRTGTDDYTLSGIIESLYDIPTITFTDTIDLDGIDNNTDASFRYLDLSSVMTCDAAYLPTSCSEEVSGRIYLENEGYIQLSTSSPLQYHYVDQFNVDVPDAGGPVFANGDLNTGIRMTPLSIIEFQIDIDVDVDSEYEFSNTYTWYDLVGLVITWEKTFGPTATFDVALSAVETSDGGFAAVGWSNTGFTNGIDFMVLKTDAVGDEVWTKYLGGIDDEYAEAIRETDDNGLVIAGYVDAGPLSYGIVYKTDAEGVEQWSRTLSNATENKIHDIQPTSDGGYVLTGYRYAPAGENFTWQQLYVVKLDQNGVIEWENTFGDLYSDYGRSVVEVPGGGFLAVGTTEIQSDTLQQDVYVVRIDADGNMVWETSFGGPYSQNAYDVATDGSGNFVISGNSYSIDPGYQYVLYKIDSTGNLLWSSVFDSTTSYTIRNSLTPSGDGGFVMVGTDSFDVEFFKLDGSGNILWTRTFNWSNFMTMCTGTSVEKTSDNGYIIGGSAWPSEGKDFYLIKTDANGVR